jgi:hypothetical protein
MNARTLQERIGSARSRREVIDVPENKVEDKSLDKLLKVRRQRLDRLERERSEARKAWRDARGELRMAKESWRKARREALEYWQQARARYFKMATTSGEFRKAKAIYERMKKQAAELRLGCLEHLEHCRQTRSGFFQARQRALQANREQEKLGVLRDEVRAANRPVEN